LTSVAARPGLAALSLEGRRALVTGGGSGLGRMIADGLAQAGAEVVVVGRRVKPLQESVDHILASGGNAVPLAADITSDPDTAQLGARAGRIDILVNCAGAAPNERWTDVSLADWRATFAVNVDAPFRLCQIFAPPMMDRGWGRIVNIASVYGRMGGNPALYVGMDPPWDVPSYFASKHAVHGITHYLAPRLAPRGVTINSLSPGGFAGSEMNDASGMGSDEMLRLFHAQVPMARRGSTDDIQAAVVFLSSPGGGYVTGQDLVVDGGWTVW